MRKKEMMQFIEDRQFIGKGLGYIDAHLIASAVFSNISTWSLDKTLSEISSKLGIDFHV